MGLVTRCCAGFTGFRLFFELDGIGDRRVLNTPFCILQVDVNDYKGAGNSFSDPSNGGDQAIDVATWRTHCVNATGGTCYEAQLTPGEQQMAAAVAPYAGRLCFAADRTAEPSLSATESPTSALPTRAPTTADPDPVATQPPSPTESPTSPLPTRIPTAVDPDPVATQPPAQGAGFTPQSSTLSTTHVVPQTVSMATTATTQAIVDPGSSTASDGSTDGFPLGVVIAVAALGLLVLVVAVGLIRRKRAARCLKPNAGDRPPANDLGASAMVPNTVFKPDAPTYASVDYAQVGKNGNAGHSTATADTADYAVAGEEGHYAVPPQPTAEYEVPQTLNQNYQSNEEAARGKPPPAAGEYDIVTFVSVSIGADHRASPATNPEYAAPDGTAVLYASAQEGGVAPGNSYSTA